MAKTQYLTAPIKTDKMPPGVPYIVGNEAAERFSYYGMNSILVIFMTHLLLNRQGQPDPMTDAQADAWYHTFVFCLYFLPILGAILGDAILGKYRTVLFLSIVYCFGHLTLAIDHTRLGLTIGLGLIALGAGGIKPCVSANVGDQFGATNQHLLPRVFSWFYFSINFGSAFSTLLIPWLLDAYKVPAEQAARLPAWLVQVLEKVHGPDIAFGTPGLLMFIATVIFWLGRKKFVHLPPVGLGRYIEEISQRENLRALANLLILVPFVAIFWSLWQQNFSSWVLQSEHMDRHLFGIDWKPAQIQTVNPIFILIMLPLFSYAVYPAIDKGFRLTPLRKIGIGLFITALAFFIVGWIQLRIDAGQTPHILWQILAFLVLTAAEVMVSVTHLEFAYTQAPKKLKSLVMCTYLGAVALGNAFTAGVNFFIQNPDKTVKLKGANYFFFFVIVMLITSALFVFFARFYKGKAYIQDEAAA
ncbi:MAG TPA: POT family MFS transporter [Candidatus Binatia bacterium]|jgi:POT family proton-dependent oligopeptide transporter|nr:POT family MFS transporter [Candidatus Binatia bacterium]